MLWHSAREASTPLPSWRRSLRGDVIGHLFLKIDAAGVVARERRALLYLFAGSVLAVLLTMAITGFWVNRLFVPRIDRTVAVLEEVRSGRTRPGSTSPGTPTRSAT